MPAVCRSPERRSALQSLQVSLLPVFEGHSEVRSSKAGNFAELLALVAGALNIIFGSNLESGD